MILFMPIEQYGKFHPLNDKGEELPQFNCILEKLGGYSIESNRHGGRGLYKTSEAQKPLKSVTVHPEISNHEGDRKEVSSNMRKHFRDDVNDIAMRFGEVISEIEEKKESLAKEIDTPFVPREKQSVALGGIEQQLDDLRSERESCNRLLAMIDGK